MTIYIVSLFFLAGIGAVYALVYSLTRLIKDKDKQKNVRQLIVIGTWILILVISVYNLLSLSNKNEHGNVIFSNLLVIAASLVSLFRIFWSRSKSK